VEPGRAAGERPFHDEYLRTAPRPEDFPRLVEKVEDLDRNVPTIAPEALRAMTAPTLIVIGDSDIVRSEYAVEVFRLLGGGIMGDTPAGLPNSQLAVLPGTSHISIASRRDLLLSIVPAFLDEPIKP
jgi:pimeloyl-ACP methyl ester carboxylesterase